MTKPASSLTCECTKLSRADNRSGKTVGEKIIREVGGRGALHAPETQLGYRDFYFCESTILDEFTL